MPNIDTCAGDGHTRVDVDHLERKTHVNALLPSADVLTFRLVVDPVGAVDRLGRKSTTADVGLHWIIPVEAEEALRIFALLIMLMIDLEPLL